MTPPICGCCGRDEAPDGPRCVACIVASCDSECRRPEGETNGWHLPYEREPDGAIYDLSDASLTGSAVFMASALNVPVELDETGAVPVLIFRFGDDPFTGEPIKPVALILDADHMRKVAALFADTVRGAIEAAQR